VVYTFSIGESVAGTTTASQYRFLQGFIQAHPKKITGLERPEVNSTPIYPNPTSSFFLINANCDCAVDVKDLAGKTVIHAPSVSGGVDVSDLSPGIYIVTIIDGQGYKISVQKLFKK
jgi:hypothetical protein